ncbi:hypothetical protein FAES_1437 [Fibrella aestuarina BUZ 2]|uniref:DUF4345 domain-containing protein n=1 Tax=Fibrella aestuarina BUZ 2 TaxID=1166018 RepID=I0K5P4_9BACT|nr:hypothetical protein [Fibrella aestuarina]CCG99447.1 hypothetical protein FAES_1437 [Fibrella aestuarina BUZ 2]
MTIRNLFSLVAFICLVFGLGLAFSPQLMANLYLTDPNWINPAARLLAQGWGAMLLGEGVACWLLRNQGSTTASRAMLWMLIVSNVVFLLVHVTAILNGVETPMAWLQVLMAVLVGGWAALLARPNPAVA